MKTAGGGTGINQAIQVKIFGQYLKIKIEVFIDMNSNSCTNNKYSLEKASFMPSGGIMEFTFRTLENAIKNYMFVYVYIEYLYFCRFLILRR